MSDISNKQSQCLHDIVCQVTAQAQVHAWGGFNSMQTLCCKRIKQSHLLSLSAQIAYMCTLERSVQYLCQILWQHHGPSVGVLLHRFHEIQPGVYILPRGCSCWYDRIRILKSVCEPAGGMVKYSCLPEVRIVTRSHQTDALGAERQEIKEQTRSRS